MESKTCLKCNEEKPVSEFSKDKTRKDNLHPYCKPFNNIKFQKWDATKTTAERKKRQTEATRKFKYGLDPHAFNEMLVEQEFRCDICQDELEIIKWKYAIDHNHSTGEVRGILCKHCNTTLGFARDNPQILDAAAAYLRKNGHYG